MTEPPCVRVDEKFDRRVCGMVFSERESQCVGFLRIERHIPMFDQFVILSRSEEKEEDAACLLKGWGMSRQRVESSAKR